MTTTQRPSIATTTTTIRPKVVGKWKLSGKCTPKSIKKECGLGSQKMVRTCTDGSRDQCKTTDMVSERKCSLKNCLKTFGDWRQISDCIPIDNVQKCGPGKILQTRKCVNGTRDLCDVEETHKMSDCYIKCQKKFGVWKKKNCVADVGNSNCGKGTRRETRTCESGTNDPCLTTEILRISQCDLGDCVTGW